LEAPFYSEIAGAQLVRAQRVAKLTLTVVALAPFAKSCLAMKTKDESDAEEQEIQVHGKSI